jgi:hypothetical protein
MQGPWIAQQPPICSGGGDRDPPADDQDQNGNKDILSVKRGTFLVECPSINNAEFIVLQA